MRPEAQNSSSANLHSYRRVSSPLRRPTRRVNRVALVVVAGATLALMAPALAGATMTCSAGGTGTLRECNIEAMTTDIRTLIGWAVGVLLFGIVVGIFTRTFRG